MKAYLEGLTGLNWIVGMIGSQVGDVKETLIGLQNHGDPKRYQALSDWFLNQA